LRSTLDGIERVCQLSFLLMSSSDVDAPTSEMTDVLWSTRLLGLFTICDPPKAVKSHFII
jgi:hypothetical protein